ncbi:xanthine dehydrogenase family protein molybdopterin-binding subunit [Belliella pelovolcani]|uniref:CO or xanthine dehydrogenase, Mo-binding subunit n=1 Tax=Belliella pelovolcani TaxID=529505 RepID=A0A1N7NIJ0_9BACT|nr:molybdopterin cofactor-binding domain-containing protein [Belliella pelovolcani]SIS98132.1 CO or xanthine dehydrogenase, Mo-binding subunit [Belliella pelovolcani]
MKNFKLPLTNRRSFLKTSGHLLIGFNLFPLSFCSTKETEELKNLYHGIPERPHKGREIIDSWIRLDAEGYVTILTGKQELGQGIRTALMQIAAEELDVPFEKCRIINGDTGQTANEGYTAGSNSVEGSGSAIRQAAAEARLFLLKEVGKEWNISIENLKVKDGIILGPEGKKKTFWEILNGKYLEENITGEAEFKSPDRHQIIGKPYQRAEILDMVQGKPHFVHDLRFPDMLHARVVHPPSYGSKLKSLDTSSIMEISGVEHVIVDGSFVAVVAKREYQAIKAWEKIRAISEWEKSLIKISPKVLFEDMKRNSAAPQQVEKHLDINSAIDKSAKTLKSTYTKPYHMHGSTGPGCSISLWKDDQLTVWSPTQGVYPLQNTLSDLFGLKKEQIRCIGMPGSGCYGHNSADDVSAESALIAKQVPGKHIRLQWMRDSEHQWEPYGSAMQIALEAGIDQEGKITAWKTQIWSDTHSTRPNGKAGHYISARHLENAFEFQKGGFSGGSYRNAAPLYTIPDRELLLHNYEGPLRTSALRGLGAYGNIFALESFMDELAKAAEIDPFEFRIKNLNNPRAIEVIQSLKLKSNWENRDQSRDVGYGLAFAQYKNSASYYAVLAEIHKSEQEGKFRLHKLTGVIDSGQCINPDGLKNQTEGGMIQSASWTILEAVQYDENGITSKDWSSYPILRTNNVPEVEVHIINRPEEKPLGAGEAAQGPVAAAIVNALSSILGRRIYDLPLREYFS